MITGMQAKTILSKYIKENKLSQFDHDIRYLSVDGTIDDGKQFITHRFIVFFDHSDICINVEHGDNDKYCEIILSPESSVEISLQVWPLI